MGETLSNWEKEIINIQKYNINNGFVEGKNNKIKVINRLSLYCIQNLGHKIGGTVFMRKLTKEDKIEIYERNENGETRVYIILCKLKI